MQATVNEFGSQQKLLHLHGLLPIGHRYMGCTHLCRCHRSDDTLRFTAIHGIHQLETHLTEDVRRKYTITTTSIANHREHNVRLGQQLVQYEP